MGVELIFSHENDVLAIFARWKGVCTAYYAAVKVVIFQKDDFFKQNCLSVHVFGPKFCAELKKMSVKLIFSQGNHVFGLFGGPERGVCSTACYSSQSRNFSERRLFQAKLTFSTCFRPKILC